MIRNNYQDDVLIAGWVINAWKNTMLGGVIIPYHPDYGEYNLLDVYVMVHKNNSTYDGTNKNRIVAEILEGIERK